jgi:hypothetical protein
MAAMRLIFGAARTDVNIGAAANSRVYLKPGCRANGGPPKSRRSENAASRCGLEDQAELRYGSGSKILKGESVADYF